MCCWKGRRNRDTEFAGRPGDHRPAGPDIGCTCAPGIAPREPSLLHAIRKARMRPKRQGIKQTRVRQDDRFPAGMEKTCCRLRQNGGIPEKFHACGWTAPIPPTYCPDERIFNTGGGFERQGVWQYQGNSIDLFVGPFASSARRLPVFCCWYPPSRRLPPPVPARKCFDTASRRLRATPRRFPTWNAASVSSPARRRPSTGRGPTSPACRPGRFSGSRKRLWRSASSWRPIPARDAWTGAGRVPLR